MMERGIYVLISVGVTLSIFCTQCKLIRRWCAQLKCCKSWGNNFHSPTEISRWLFHNPDPPSLIRLKRIRENIKRRFDSVSLLCLQLYRPSYDVGSYADAKNEITKCEHYHYYIYYYYYYRSRIEGGRLMLSYQRKREFHSEGDALGTHTAASDHQVLLYFRR